MKKLLKIVGKVAFFAGLPVLRLMMNGSERTRLLMVCEGRILVVKGWLGDDRWNLPGGGIHNGEEMVWGLLREVNEETGIELNESQVTRLSSAQHSEYGLRYTYYCFRAELAERPITRKQWYEISDIAWMLPKEFNATNAAEDVLQAVGHLEQHGV